MGRQEVIYCPIESYHACLGLMKKEKQTFEVTSTTYTRKIKMEGYTVLFNEDGEPDFNILCLINKVRKDARKFIGISEDTPIDFFDMIKKPDRKRLIKKIDLKSAYWTLSLQLGVITEETNQYFIKNWGEATVKRQKMIRLKALGSLATTRTITQYIEGKRSPEPQQVVTELTKKIYTEVQRGIDEIMKGCSEEVNQCYYYYTDCMFVDGDFADEAIKYFRKKNFDVGVEETKLEYISLGGTGYLCSQVDGIMYVTREEDGSYLPDLDEEKWL